MACWVCYKRATRSPGDSAVAEIVVIHPVRCQAERTYILDVVLRDWLGLSYVTVAHDRADVRLACAGAPDGEALVLSDAFFRLAAEDWLGPRSVPQSPLRRWFASNDLPELA